MSKELTPLHDLILRLIAIAECWGIEGGLNNIQITEAINILEPAIPTSNSKKEIK